MSAIQLYKLTGALRELEGTADEDMPVEAIRDTLEGLRGEIELKAADIIGYARNQEVLADAIDEAAKTMRDRAAKLRRRVEWLHHYVLDNMHAAGISRIETPLLVASIQKNPPSVIIDTEWLIPQEFMVTPEPPPARPDKKRLAEAIKSGTDVPGCHLEQTERLRVKS